MPAFLPRGLVAALALTAPPAAPLALAAEPGTAIGFAGFLEAVGIAPEQAADPAWAIMAGLALATTGLAVVSAFWAAAASRQLRQMSGEDAERYGALEARLEAAEAILAAEPDAVFIWTPATLRAAPGTLQALPRVVGSKAILVDPATGAVDFDYFVSRLTVDHAPRLTKAVERLRVHGTRFSLHVQSRDGHIFEAEGRPAGAQAVLWLRDVTGERLEITRLVEGARAAETARDQLAQLVNALPFPVWRRDETGRLEFVNAAYVRAADAGSSTEVLERQIEIAGADAEAFGREALARASRIRKRVNLVIEGERRTFDMTEIRLDQGSAGAAIDITAMEEVEAELERHIEAHSGTLERLKTAVAIYGPDKRLKFFNQAFVSLWHLDPDWLASNPSDPEILDALRAERRLPEQANYQAWKSQRLEIYRAAEPLEEYWHLPDGRTLRSIAQAHPFGGVIYLYENVTEQLNLESSYRTLANVQRETLDHLHEGVAVFGADGRLKLYNPAFSRIWQLGERELADEPHIDEIVEACRALFDGTEVWEDLKGRITSVVSLRAERAGQLDRIDGTVVDYAIAPLPDGATMLTFVDVTDSINIERALRDRNEALETADRLKSEFISHVSYQLRTPLTNIIGFGEILESELFGELDERQHEYTMGILESSHQLLDTVNDILDLSTIEAGAMTLDLSDVDIAKVVEAAGEFARRTAQKNKVNLKIDCPADIGTLRADEKRIKQVMLNLMSNALAFTTAGDDIVVGAERDASELRLYVADTGEGIKPEHQANVFDRFEARTGPNRRRGAGLGLSLVRSFVELHGGWVTLESAPGVGTRVTCHLPLRTLAAGPATSAPGDQSASL